MPIYDYRCTNNHDFELMLDLESRDAGVLCPRCGELGHRTRSPAPHIAPIGGIPNKLNLNWRETGKRLDTPEMESLIEGATKPA